MASGEAAEGVGVRATASEEGEVKVGTRDGVRKKMGLVGDTARATSASA